MSAFAPRAWLLVSAAFLFPSAQAVMTEAGEGVELEPVPQFHATPVSEPLEFPSSFAFLPDGESLVSERSGLLKLVHANGSSRPIEGVPPMLVLAHAGLICVAADPGFAANRTVYLSYVHGTETASTIRVMRARLDPLRYALIEQKVIFESTPSSRVEHLGGRILVTEDGYLFLTLGDRQEPDRAQDLTDYAGSIIRIRTDGSIPPDNPFVSVFGARPEIWSYGHRNPQGLALDPATGKLWAHEHGAMGGDELNLILPGRNYGWPIITYGTEYSGEPIGEGVEKEGLEQPVYYWLPDIAPSGLAVETKGHVTTFWIGTLVGQALIRLQMKEGGIVSERRFLQNEVGRIRDVSLAVDGHLYLATDAPEGGFYRVDALESTAVTEAPPDCCRPDR
jgi:aldose sugar dehydrogenase